MTRVFTKRALRIAMIPLLGLAVVPAASPAQVRPAVQAAVAASADPGVAAFYKARSHRPIWVGSNGVMPAADRLVVILRNADLDGLESGPRLAERLERSIERANAGDPQELARTELMLSNAWVEYVQTLRRPVDTGMVFADRSLAPPVLYAAPILEAAADAPSLARHLEEVSNLNPIYSRLREGLAALREGNASIEGASQSRRQAERRLLVNLDRARLLPAGDEGRYILVDAASQRLWMYEDGRVRDSMKVVVGKPSLPTPMLAGSVRQAILNPFWNVPPDLVRTLIAPNVLDQGVGYLKARKYEVLSGWSDNARTVDPETVDWEAVAAGKKEVRVRQQPGPANSMGDMKFEFPNQFGVYLHDTPDKSLFDLDARTASAGCVRLEDAPRLARFLAGKTLRARSDSPEQAMELPEPVPVYITYLTADWDGERLAFADDVYDRDVKSTRMAASSRTAAGGASGFAGFPSQK